VGLGVITPLERISSETMMVGEYTIPPNVREIPSFALDLLSYFTLIGIGSNERGIRTLQL